MQNSVVKTCFSPSWFFVFSRNSMGTVLVDYPHSNFGLVEPETLGRSLPFSQVGVEVFNVGGWLTHGDLALDFKVDFFLAVVEHRLIPARVRSEWARLGKRRVASIRAPACQGSSHVGNARGWSH